MHWYAQLAEPLKQRKTVLTRELQKGTKGPTRKRQAIRSPLEQPTDAELEPYRLLQEAFAKPTFLTYFDPQRKLFIDLDSSKSWGFAGMLYHVDGEWDPEKPISRTAVRPIMFLSKSLNKAEANYWPTELEIAGIVWVVRKVRHMIESPKQPPTIIYTDHSAAVQIARQQLPLPAQTNSTFA